MEGLAQVLRMRHRSVHYQIAVFFALILPLMPHLLQKEQDLGKLELLNFLTDS